MSRALAKTLVLAKRGLAIAGFGYGIGGHAASGGLIGGGIGAIGGAVTNDNDINPDRPIWR